MITLRELQTKDAEFMLEWMHDPIIQKSFRKDMLGMTLNDAIKFCEESKIPNTIKEGDSVHYAIVDGDDDEYLGTISLKDISLINKNAEYAISTRKKAHGRGIAKCATGILLKKAFREFNLHRIFLNVLSTNNAAIHLYEHSGFRFEAEFREHMYRDNTYVSLLWYAMLEEEYNEKIFGV